MRLYARPSWMLIRQLIADAFVVAWGLFWWWAGRLTDTTIRAIAEPSRHVAGALRQMRDNIGGAAGRVGEIPYVGGDVRVPFDRLTGDVDGMIASADGQVHAIENAATLMGWVTFALPLLLWDEYGSSQEAAARRAHLSQRRRRAPLDAEAAAVILQDYLESRASQN